MYIGQIVSEVTTMQFWISEQARLYALVVLCALLWTLESVAPLYRYGKRRTPHAFPNVMLALLLVLTNLVLSAGTARLATFSDRHGIGLFRLLEFSAPMMLVFGVAALDFSGYWAPPLLHQSWLGWQFHRVHHSETTVDVTTA